jgi:hypothetical protein
VALTVLELWGIGVPPYSARGLQQTLEPIEAALDVVRTVNGDLADFSHEQFRKYKSTITGSDQQAPAVDGVWPGQLVTVDCIQEMAYADSGGPQRTAVPGSVRAESGWSFYRPRLLMMVTGFTLNTDEWGAQIGWTMTLEEI